MPPAGSRIVRAAPVGFGARSWPKRAARFLSLYASFRPVKLGARGSPGRTRWQARSREEHTGQYRWGMCAARDPLGHFSKKHVSTVRDPPAICSRQCSFITRCSLDIPTTAQAESNHSVGSRRTSGEHSDWTPGGNAKVARNACINSSDRPLYRRISRNNLPVAAGRGAQTASPPFARLLEACDAAIGPHLRPHTKKRHAFTECGRNL